MKKDSKIFVAGHRGMVGSAILRKLKSEGYTNIVTKSKKELDLTMLKDFVTNINTKRLVTLCVNYVRLKVSLKRKNFSLQLSL